jgi:hypothetical protein
MDKETEVLVMRKYKTTVSVKQPVIVQTPEQRERDAAVDAKLAAQKAERLARRSQRRGEEV